MIDRRHRAAIVTGGDPEPGYYTRRLVRNGPVVGAAITKHADGTWSVMLDGKEQGPSDDPWSLPLMHDVFLATPATEAEVKYRIGVRRWAEIYKPDHPAAQPRKPIDPADLPPVF